MQNDSVSNMIRSDDINWTAVETTLRTERVNAKMLRERFAAVITPATWKKWTDAALSPKYTVDWGKQGKNNYIRLLPKDQGDILVAQLKAIISEHGLEPTLRAFGEATKR